MRADAINTYETSATVEEQGQVRVAGVPFAPGTEVEVTIREKVATNNDRSEAKPEEASVRMRDLFARAGADAVSKRSSASWSDTRKKDEKNRLRGRNLP
jgi:hypothetical protein